MACKAEEESGLSPTDDKNAAGQKIYCEDVFSFVEKQYKIELDDDSIIRGFRAEYTPFCGNSRLVEGGQAEAPLWKKKFRNSITIR